MAATSAAPAVQRVRVVEIPFAKLVDPDADLTQELWQVRRSRLSDLLHVQVCSPPVRGLRAACCAPAPSAGSAPDCSQQGGQLRPQAKTCPAAGPLRRDLLPPAATAAAQGFGPDGLGIVTVSGCPDFERLREQLLPLAAAFAVRDGLQMYTRLDLRAQHTHPLPTPCPPSPACAHLL